MSSYSLWQPDNTTVEGVEACDDAHAVAIFSERIGVELTLDEVVGGVTYMMRREQAQDPDKPQWVKPHDIPVWVKPDLKC